MVLHWVLIRISLIIQSKNFPCVNYYPYFLSREFDLHPNPFIINDILILILSRKGLIKCYRLSLCLLYSCK